MSNFTPAETLHRLVKQAMDSGAARSLAEAEALFRGYRLALSIEPAEGSSLVHQSALLTAVALGRRVFLGGVTVAGDLNVPLTASLPLGRTLLDAVKALGGVPGVVAADVPLIAIGGGARPRRPGFGVRTAVSGWRGGIVPLHSDASPVSGPDMPLAAMLAAALAVNEAFLSVNGSVPAAGYRTLGLSLWRPESTSNWLAADPEEPPLTYLPSRLWLIGLGHLGQAYLWGLGLLPYPRPSDLSLVLQDVDVITPSTESTSILSEAAMAGTRKTRAMAAWAEEKGFMTAIYERLFDANFRRQADEPAIALCGLDNALGRQALDHVGFDLVVEAGLGRGHHDFRKIRMHVLPGPRPAADMWKATAPGEQIHDQLAYRRMLDSGELDRCGVTILAGKAVGAPFVGATAATLALSEILRLLHGGRVHQMIDLDLESIEHRSMVAHPADLGNLNPGYVSV